MPEEHEVYPNAPLVLVTAQVRFAHEPRLNSGEVRDVFAELVRGSLPVLDIETVEHDGDTVKQLRATNEKRTVSAAVSTQSLTIEATEYTHFGDFAQLLTTCFTGLERAVGSVYVERAGLRYVDEVRPPNVESTRDWEQWICPDLVTPARFLPEMPAVGLRGVTVYGVGDRTVMVFQWGEVIGRSVVAPSTVVRKSASPDGRFFVLDADTFWVPESPIAARPTELVERFHELHTPASAVFRTSLTKAAESLFRGGKNG